MKKFNMSILGVVCVTWQREKFFPAGLLGEKKICPWQKVASSPNFFQRFNLLTLFSSRSVTYTTVKSRFNEWSPSANFDSLNWDFKLLNLN